MQAEWYSKDMCIKILKYRIDWWFLYSRVSGTTIVCKSITLQLRFLYNMETYCKSGLTASTVMVEKCT